MTDTHGQVRNKTMFEGSYLHDSLTKMAAAYGFHLCKKHPFIDRNKRIALVAMDTFLQNNGYEIFASEKEAYEVIIKLASSELSKEELNEWLKKNIRNAEITFVNLQNSERLTTQQP